MAGLDGWDAFGLFGVVLVFAAVARLAGPEWAVGALGVGMVAVWIVRERGLANRRED